MSIHLVQCAAEVELLNPRLKVALLCFAESGKGDERIARPGFKQLAKWVGVGKSQVHNLINDLIELQLIARHAPGYRGHVAEYIVFPNGCCELHGKRPAAIVDDGGAVVHITVDDASTASTCGVDAFEPIGSTAIETKGPLDGEKGSTRPPVKRPLLARESGALQVHTSKEPPTATTSPSGSLHQPLPSRDATATSIDLAAVDRQSVGRQLQPTGFALGCRHCDAGYVCDADGLPLEKCRHCHPAHRARGVTA